MLKEEKTKNPHLNSMRDETCDALEVLFDDSRQDGQRNEAKKKSSNPCSAEARWVLVAFILLVFASLLGSRNLLLFSQLDKICSFQSEPFSIDDMLVLGVEVELV